MSALPMPPNSENSRPKDTLSLLLDNKNSHPNPLAKKTNKKLFRTPLFNRKYTFFSAINLLLIILVVINGLKPAQKLISPIMGRLQTKEVFAFAPSLAQNKFSHIDFNGLNILAFFDVPIDLDGGLNHNSRGYNSFISEETQSLFNKAHSYGTKVVLTTTLTDNEAIQKFLTNPSFQQAYVDDIKNVIDQSGIEGVSIDIEPETPLDSYYKNNFNNFVQKVKTDLHQKNPNLLVTVVVPSSQSNGFYDLSKLSKNSDKVFVMASDFIVPETKAGNFTLPVYGFGDTYWKNVSDHISSFFSNVDNSKLVLERAWYGNGDQYPLYKPSLSSITLPQVDEPANVFLDNETIDRLVRGVPQNARAAARNNIPLIGNALREQGILDQNVLAYALATVEHETAGTFAPISEIQGRKSARRLGYEGGMNYYGRGFIQLTHLRNYKVMGERIGMGDALAQNPDLASTPEVAAKILAAFFKDNNIASLASRGNYIAARSPINPDANAYLVADLALKYNDQEVGY